MNTWPTAEESEANEQELLELLKREPYEAGIVIPLDAVTSKQTVELVTAFGAKGVDMTTLWAMTPQNWTCSACGRAKRQIVRLNRNNDLICRLVEHHDHMQQLLEKRFEEISCDLKEPLADRDAVRFAERASAMVSAFDNTVVCDDCNVADVNAKKISGADEAFSFSPSELLKITIKRDNAPHEINEEIALGIWEENKKTFQLRLEMVDKIAYIAATNAHWFQSSVPANRAKYVESSAKDFLTRSRVFADFSFLTGLKKNKKPDNIAEWRMKSFPRFTGTITEGQIQHIAKVKCAKAWDSLPDNWKCPGCDRTKVASIKHTNKNGLGFSIFERSLWDSTQPKRRIHKKICTDCGWVAERLGEEARNSVGAPKLRLSALVSMEDIRDVVIPRNNSRHAIKSSQVELILPKIAARINYVDLLATDQSSEEDI